MKTANLDDPHCEVEEISKQVEYLKHLLHEFFEVKPPNKIMKKTIDAAVERILDTLVDLDDTISRNGL